MRKIKDVAQQRNERDGNRTSAREYSEEPQRLFRWGSGDRKAYEVKRDRRERDIRREIEAVPAIGRRHAD